MQYMLKQ